jgi:2',3'-cyclic-nucleotide 2'-phosphodiesterase (5'-nucleotidase family)
MNQNRIRPHAYLKNSLIITLLCLNLLPTFGQSISSQSSDSVKKDATQTLIDGSIPEDTTVLSIIEPYRAKVKELDRVIGRLEGEIKKGGMGGGLIGNLVVDAIKDRTKKITGKRIDLAIYNNGGLRRNFIAGGDIRAIDIFETLPFENSLVIVELNGAQLLRLLELIVKNRDAQVGVKIVYKSDPKLNDRLIKARLENKRRISPTSTYTIVTIDYLVNRGGDYAILKEAKQIRPLNILARDAVIDYIREHQSKGKIIRVKFDKRFESK